VLLLVRVRAHQVDVSHIVCVCVCVCVCACVRACAHVGAHPTHFVSALVRLDEHRMMCTWTSHSRQNW
jgi:hypothetical protein